MCENTELYKQVEAATQTLYEENVIFQEPEELPQFLIEQEGLID